MDFFVAYLLSIVAGAFVIYILALSVACLADFCFSFIDYVRYQWRLRIIRRNLDALWSRQNNSRDNISMSTQWRSPAISSAHRMPREARQINRAANTLISSAHRMPHEARQINSTADTHLMTNRSERAAPLSREPDRSNAGTTIPHATQQSSFRVPIPCTCGAHQSNILSAVPVRTTQQHTMFPLSYMPSPDATAGTHHIPAVRMHQSQVMAPVMHAPHQSQPTMTPPQHGSQTNSGTHTAHRTLRSLLEMEAAHESQRMAPEPREGPNRPHSDIDTYIFSSKYRRYDNDKNTECTICLGDLKRGEMVMRMPLCSHVYHEKCICQWLMQEPTCPLCRSPVRAQLSVRVGHS